MTQIVFDVDNVLSDTTSYFCRKASKSLGIQFTKDQVKHHKIVGCVPISANEIFRLQNEVWDEWPLLPTTEPGIPDLFAKLRQKGHSISIATCRPIRSKDSVIKWLAKNCITYDSFHSLGPYRNKVDVDFEVLVDDVPEQIALSIQKGRRGILYSQPWNLTSNIHKAERINHLSDLLEMI